MKTAKASVYLDEKRPKTNGLCSVKIKITYNRKRKYFTTGIDLSPEEFEGMLRPAFKEDEWSLILVGAALGFLVGEMQIHFML